MKSKILNVSNLILLDTHVLLWAISEPNKLSTTVKQYIDVAQQNKLLLLSSISLWEIAMFEQKKRIDIRQSLKTFLESIINIQGLAIKDISVEVAVESNLLADSFHNDPADRLIVATAKYYNATLLTRDQKILAWAEQGAIESLKV
ncbi:MAG TPA: type II toxin-antitoxin system VapC family toxin [Rickettsia endosymbiont of Bembidion nr. Transversale]|nr:type II toxin-antitoxin system VapC family toxin [Rickettsia endosymbiont of Bembidion nr. Transversale]